MISVLRQFFQEACPLFSGKKIKVNYLGDVPECFSVFNVSDNPVVKKYTDGGSLNRFVFCIAARMFYDREDSYNLSAASFFSDLEKWICSVDRQGIYPEIPDGKCVSLRVLESSCIDDSDAKSGEYRLTCCLVYETEGVVFDE